ncbi:hypothetical protein BA190_10115 [Labrys sp. WJW]|uniref:terminase gpA endonuclease subunit n=1 Tax=Labrys sp. WJW TaxID=1737983 RepID=UPI00082E4526|nr:terminase gpA endonuclease subunit [Labrys sp. WJW]OCC05248.1 hypothetical protein BA190_10115 [Labrys sp. WJW]
MSHPDANALVRRVLSGAIRPRPRISVSKWLCENLVLVDGEYAGELWSPAGAPYLVEIADCLNEWHPAPLITVRKAQQTGVSILAMGWAIFCADREPANFLYGAPGIEALRKLNSQKLQPLIEAFEKRAGRAVFAPQTQRSGKGSTTNEKKFPGGVLALANANAVMDLSAVTMKKGVKDEVSKWEDIPGKGDPETFFFGRFTAFRRTKSYKILELSTPEIDLGDETLETPGHCRIDRSFRRSDQRFWNIACVECGGEFVQVIELFQVDRKSPHRSTMLCPHCGHRISEAERVPAVRDGRYVATEPVPNHPGFHVDGFMSLMVSYEDMAEEYLKSLKSEKDNKDFHNLFLGRAYKFRGDAPDHKLLMERREDALIQRRVPADGLLLTAMVDVQHNGLFFEVVAWTASRRSYVVDHGFLVGDTTNIAAGAWVSLEEVYERAYADPWGRLRTIDVMGVDAGDGGRANQVYAWTAAHLNAMALKGEDGWAHPAISAQPKLVDIDMQGRVQKHGAKLWKTGTWSLKREFYDNLRKPRLDEEGQVNPGYCHFGRWQDEAYFKQITSEYLDDIKVRGVVTGRKWVARGDNHYLDCRIGNMALAEYLGLTRMTEAEWRKLAEMRGVPEAEITPDLFAPAPLKVQADPPPDSPPVETPPAKKLGGMFARLSKINAGV